MRITVRALVMTISLMLLILTTPIAFAATIPTLSVGDASGDPGEMVSVPVSIKNNSGIIALYCSISYDDTQLKLSKVTNGTVLTDPAHSDVTVNPYRLCFDMSLATDNNASNGVIATLDFEILSTAKAGDTELAIYYDTEEIYDYELKNVYFETMSGKVTIVSENTDALPPGSTTSKSSEEPIDKIEIDIEPKGSSTESDTNIEVAIEPNAKTPWDKVMIGGDRIQDKNITTEQIVEGLIVRGDNLSEVTVEIQKDDKKASIEIETDQKEILLEENETGKVDVHIDMDGDGTFETPLGQSVSFDKTDDSASNILKISISAILVIAIIGFVLFAVKKNKLKAKQKDTKNETN